MSIFTGMETARRALMAQQQALNTTNHNIANANTPGFSRQQAVFATTPAYTLGHSLAGKALEMGTGVKIEDIRRMRDSFLDYQFRSEVKEQGRWEVRRGILQKLEVVINEPSEAGLATVLDGFWDSWQELSENPESGTARAVVLQQGIALVDTINHLERHLHQLRQDLNQTLEIQINEINSLARQIADLNGQIIRVEASSKKANDLRDKRDLLVDQLAKLTGVHVTESESGAIDVVIGNRGLVEGTRALSLEIAGDTSTADLYPVWNDGMVLTVNAGSLKGIAEARQLLDDFQGKIDALVKELAEAVNAIHAEGYGLDGEMGRPFFVAADGGDIDPGNIAVNQDLMDNPDLLAAARDPGELPGDGSNALALAQLRHKPLPGLGETTSLTDYYNGLVADLGIQAREAERMASNQELVTGQIDLRREMVAGVNLDEEVANMIRFQHAYNAAARMVTAIDEMLDVLVNRMGVVGR
ncbi:MAG: flagellar hook-associated protein FlgK [bacterium]|jgi:flagellar hook-associated protein 1 FlgK